MFDFSRLAAIIRKIRLLCTSLIPMMIPEQLQYGRPCEVYRKQIPRDENLKRGLMLFFLLLSILGLMLK